jgi:hypothetical protein
MVTDDFNPFEQWLGVSTDSPDYYELLGLRPEESDRSRIAAAADRAIARVRSHRPGDRSVEWAWLLDELRSIKQTLTDPLRKEEYDAALGKKRNSGARKASARKTPPAPQAKTPPADADSLDNIQLDEHFASRSPRRRAQETHPTISDGHHVGIDLSYLSAPGARPAQKAPPKQGSAEVSPDELDRVDDIVLPPSAGPLPAQSSPSQNLVSPSPSKAQAVRPTRAAIPDRKRTRRRPASRIFGGTMTCLLIAGGIYAFLFHEDQDPGERPPESTPVRGTLLTEQERASILSENARRNGDTRDASPLAHEGEVLGGADLADELVESAPDVPMDSSPIIPEAGESMLANLPLTSSSDTAPPIPIEHRPQADAAPLSADMEPAALTPEEQAEWETLWSEIPAAVTAYQREQAAALFLRARPLARQPEQKARIARWESLSDLLVEFQGAVRQAMNSLEAGTSFPISDSTHVVVVERLSDGIIIRAGGKNHTFSLTELPLALGLALAERGLPPGPRAKAVLGAFQAVHPRASKAHRETARQLWLEAADAGEATTDLLPILDQLPR